jgi:SAM-dependent methyltransferase
MSDWPDIEATYDQVAAEYAAAFLRELDGKPFDRALLDRFAAATAGRGPVWDVGCGPGHVTRYLADRGVEAVGVDLSARMVEVARRHHPGLAFRRGDLLALPAGDGELAGLVVFYSLIHLERWKVPAALGELRRCLAPRAPLLLAVHGGEGEAHADGWLGRQVAVRATLFGTGELSAALAGAGLRVVESHERDPYDFEYPSRRLYLWAERS